MNIINNVSTPGLNAGRTRIVNTALRATASKNFGAQIQNAVSTLEQDVDVREEIGGVEPTPSGQEEIEEIVLKRDDPEIQTVLAKMVDGKIPLTEAQLAYLTERYNATNMTGEEYEAFTEDLKEMGILGRTEREAVHGENPRWGRLNDYHGSDHYPASWNKWNLPKRGMIIWIICRIAVLGPAKVLNVNSTVNTNSFNGQNPCAHWAVRFYATRIITQPDYGAGAAVTNVTLRV